MAKAYYFQHDYHAREDPKLLAVQEKYGVEGYGFFFMLIEYMYENGGKLKIETIDSFAYRVHFDAKKAHSIINDFGLFEHDDVFFWSPSVLRRIEKIADVADKRRQAARSRWNVPVVKPEEKKAVNKDKTDCEEIVRLYHQYCPSLPTVLKLTESRKNKIRTRNKEFGSLDAWIEIFKRTESSEFCKGENKRGWKADFDFIIANDNNSQKILSGRYDNRQQNKQTEDKNVNTEWT